MQDSLAKTLAFLENRQAYLREPDQVFTAKSCASLAWYDQSSCSWRTYQQSFLADSEPYLETWPRWGMTAGGSAFAHPMSERRITETDGSYWLTPRVVEIDETVENFRARMNSKRPNDRKNGYASLSMQVKDGFNPIFPTPTTIDAGTGRFNTSVGSSNHRPTLAMMAKKALWPTPNASDCRDRGDMSNPSVQRRAEIGKQLGLSMVVHPTSGQLNPNWVGWLMGFPIGFAQVKGK